MKVTITGAAGRIGRAVVRALCDSGYQVKATDVSYNKDLPVPLEVANLLDREVCYSLLQGADAVVHLGNHSHAWRRDPQHVYGENLTMNVNVFQAAQEMGVRKLVFASSVQTIAGRRGPERNEPSSLAYLPLDGNVPVNPGNVYALSKKAAEDMLAYYAKWNPQMTCVALRFPLVPDEHMLARIRQRPWAHYEALDEAFSYLTLPDATALVEAILRASFTGFRVYMPASPGNLANRAPADLIREFYPNVPLRKPVEQIEALVDVSQIERETGWTPRHGAFDQPLRRSA